MRNAAHLNGRLDEPRRQPAAHQLPRHRLGRQPPVRLRRLRLRLRLTNASVTTRHHNHPPRQTDRGWGGTSPSRGVATSAIWLEISLGRESFGPLGGHGFARLVAPHSSARLPVCGRTLRSSGDRTASAGSRMLARSPCSVGTSRRHSCSLVLSAVGPTPGAGGFSWLVAVPSGSA